jgi:hypothetical protein
VPPSNQCQKDEERQVRELGRSTLVIKFSTLLTLKRIPISVLSALVLGAAVVTFHSRKTMSIEGILTRWKPYTEAIMEQVSSAFLFKFRMNRETI